MDRREQEDIREAKAVRAKLEKMSGGGQRFDLVGNLNRMVSNDTAKAMPGVAAYLLLMEMQAHHGQHARRLNKSHDRYFDRLHPSSALSRAAADVSTTAGRIRDADGDMRTADRRGHADHWSGQGGRFLDEKQMKEKLRLSLEQMRALATAAVTASRYF